MLQRWTHLVISILGALVARNALAAEGPATFANVDTPVRTWEFNLKTPGTYKVQVEHRVDVVAPRPKVVYSVAIGGQVRSREFDMIANRPFIPLIADVSSAQEIRVVINGLTQGELRHTSVHVYDANSRPPWEYFDPKKSVDSTQVRKVRSILTRPTSRIDFANAKLTIDKMIDSAIDVDASTKIIDDMA